MSQKQFFKAVVLPEKSAVIFATKGVIAMAVSLYFAMYLNLERPYWALISAVFLQLRQENGLVIEKGLCQIIGSVVGGAVAIILLNLFLPYPELCLGCLALWLGMNAYLSSMVRRVNFIYAFAMAGMTPTLIIVMVMMAYSTIDSQVIFDVTQARVSELVLGAICATVVSRLFWPMSVKENLRLHARNALIQMFHYLVIELDTSKNHDQRHQHIDSIMESLSILSDDSSAVRYEGPYGPGLNRATSLFLNKIMSLLAVIQIFGRIQRQHPELCSGPMSQIIESMKSHFLQMKQAGTYDESYRIAQNLRREQLTIKQSSVLENPLQLRLIKTSMELTRDLIVTIQSYRAIKQNEGVLLKTPSFKPYRDRLVGLSTALRTVTMFVAASALWLETGSTSVILMMVLPVVFSIMMARLPLMLVSIVLKRVLVGIVYGSVMAIFYSLNLIAQSSGDFPLLVLIMAGPLYIGLVSLANRPTMPYGIGICITFIILVKPSTNMSTSFAMDMTLSSAFVLFMGVLLLFWLFHIVTAPSISVIQRGLIQSTVNDLKELSSRHNAEDWFNARMGDRILRLVTFDQRPHIEERVMTDFAFTGLNLGHLVIKLARLIGPNVNNPRIWKQWVSALSEAYSLAFQGQYSATFLDISALLMDDIDHHKVGIEELKMIEGMVQRIGMTLHRSSENILALKA